MKKIYLVIFALLLMIFLVSCSNGTAENTNTSDISASDHLDEETKTDLESSSESTAETTENEAVTTKDGSSIDLPKVEF